MISLHDEGLFDNLVTEDLDRDIRVSIRKRLEELRPDLPVHTINALQWYHTLLVKTGKSKQWTLRQDCGETLVRPYYPHFQEALQQDVEVKVVIGAEHLEPEIPSDLGPGSGWKQISRGRSPNFF